MGSNFLDLSAAAKAATLQKLRGDFRDRVFKFGYGTVGTTWSAIWDGGNGYPGFFDTPKSFTAESSSAQDAVGGSGAWALEVTGIDSNGEQSAAYVTLTGATPVAIPGTFYCIFRARFLSEDGSAAGANNDIVTGPNAGNILIKETVSGDTCAKIAITTAPIISHGQTLMALSQVPANKYGKLKDVDFYLPAGKNITCVVKYNVYGSNTWLTASKTIGTENKTEKWFKKDQLLLPMTRLIALAVIDTGASEVGCTYEYELLDLPYVGE